MKTTKWLLAGALVSFGGAAFAGSGADCKDPEHKHDKKADASRSESKPASDDSARSEFQEEGEEVRASMERGAERTEDKVEESADRAQEKAGEYGERASGRAEAVGSGVADSVDEATTAIQGQPSRYERGSLEDGEVNNTLTLNPLGFVTGSGLDLTYGRPLSPKISALGGASLARTSAGDGAATRIGLRAGLDYFLIGQNNEGLRVGPRIETAFGAETSGENSAFGNLGAAAELGYNWISARGLTAGAGVGMAAGFGGTSDNGSPTEDVDNFDADVNPYARLQIGYSW